MNQSRLTNPYLKENGGMDARISRLIQGVKTSTRRLFGELFAPVGPVGYVYCLLCFSVALGLVHYIINMTDMVFSSGSEVLIPTVSNIAEKG